MEQLIKLISLCGASVNININEHRTSYQSVSEYIDETKLMGAIENEEIDSEVLSEMISRDIIVQVQFYPRTPVSFYVVFHYDIEQAIKEALEIIASFTGESHKQ